MVIIILSPQAQSRRQKILKQSIMNTVTFILWWKCCGRKETVAKPLKHCWKPVSLVSWVTADILQPSSCISCTARWFHVRAVSTATVIINMAVGQLPVFGLLVRSTCRFARCCPCYIFILNSPSGGNTVNNSKTKNKKKQSQQFLSK